MPPLPQPSVVADPNEPETALAADMGSTQCSDRSNVGEWCRGHCHHLADAAIFVWGIRFPTGWWYQVVTISRPDGIMPQLRRHVSASRSPSKPVERTWTVLTRGIRYRLRDLDGQPISCLAATQMITDRCTLSINWRSSREHGMGLQHALPQPASRQRGVAVGSAWSARRPPEAGRRARRK